jgi:Pyruvate/2-oxoglutarate dehydrogenase complex, dihydrolipoamide dehydrogenase (E3) component, and related enzymes
MAQDFTVAIIGSGTALLVAVGGWITSYRLAAKGNKVSFLEKRLTVLEKECQSRIAIEKVASRRIAELTGVTELSAMRQIRKQTQRETGLRPRLTPRDVEGR